MREDRIAVHARAVNLARRYTVQNENDLMQEDFFEEPAVKKMMDQDQCQELARHLVNVKGLPDECKKFRDVTSDLKRRDTDTISPTQYLG